MTSRFRPIEVHRPFRVKHYLLYGKLPKNYNWVPYQQYVLAKQTNPNSAIRKAFLVLHYLATHSPEKVQIKYRKAYNRFYKKHFGSEKANMKYLNKYSCHSWL